MQTPLEADVALAAVDIDSSLAKLGYRVAVRDTVRWLWVSEPTQEWPPGTADETWHGVQHPGLIAYVWRQETPSGYSLVAAARVLCNLVSPEDAARPESVESMLKTLVPMQIMADLAERRERTGW